jgi:hypothetical protein
MRDRVTGILFLPSGVLFIGAVANPAIVGTFSQSLTDAMAAYAQHRTAWAWSSWLLAASVVAGLVAHPVHTPVLMGEKS